jgi:hypothetical protein
VRLDEALLLFRRLAIDVEALTPAEFTAAYHRLAWRYHPDVNPGSAELMANINAARSVILESYRPLFVIFLPFGLAVALALST